jgi:hypothetical protein
MVKGHERKSYQPSSSAKAAQLVANSGPKGGFGFGGYVQEHMFDHWPQSSTSAAYCIAHAGFQAQLLLPVLLPIVLQLKQRQVTMLLLLLH